MLPFRLSITTMAAAMAAVPAMEETTGDPNVCTNCVDCQTTDQSAEAEDYDREGFTNTFYELQLEHRAAEEYPSEIDGTCPVRAH